MPFVPFVARRRSWLSGLASLAAAVAFSGLMAPPAQAFDLQWGGGTRVDGSGRPGTEARSLRGFQAVATRGSIDVLVRQTGHEAVQVQADDNIVPLIETTVETRDGLPTLVVGVKRGHSLHPKSPMRVVVEVAQLRAASSSGSGDIRIESLQTPSLKVSIAGSADARVGSLQTDDLAVSISGSGDVEAAGRASKLAVSVSGSGDVRLKGLQSDDASVNIAGSGNAELTVARNLSVSIAGSGDVVYHGDAKVASRVAGSGSVTRR